MLHLIIGSIYQITAPNSVDRVEWQLAEIMDDGTLLRFVDPKTKTTILPLTTYDEFLRAIAERRVRRIPIEGKGHRFGKAGREDLAPIATDRFAPLRLAITEAYDAGGFTKGGSSLRRLAAKVLRENSELRSLGWYPSAGAVRDWIKNRGEPGYRLETEMINRSGRVTRKRRRSVLALEIVRRSSAWYYAGTYRSPEQAWAWACKLRKKLNGQLRLRKGDKLATAVEPIKEKWVRLQIADDRCYEMVEKKWSTEAAISEYGGSTATIIPKEALDRVIIDGTRAKVHVVDLINGRYLGRPWVVYAIDVKTRMPLGWVIMFSHESLQFAIEVLRHVVLPKLDLKERYGLKRDAEAFGAPVTILVDNSWAQTGAGFRRACRSQGIRVEWAPVKTPRYKPIVERFVRTVHTRIFQRARGGIGAPPNVLRKLGLNPLKDKCMTVLQLREAVTKCCVDDIPYRRHGGLRELPIAAWHRYIEQTEIETIDDPKFLDGLGKVIRNRTLTKDGLTYDGHQYGAEPEVLKKLLRDLQGSVPARQRRQQGSSATAKTDIVRSPENIGRISIFNPKTQTNFTLTVRGPDAEILDGMSEFAWEGICEYARNNQMDFESPDDRAEVVNEIRILLDSVDERAKAAERFRYQQMRDGLPQPSLQGDTVTVIKVSPDRSTHSPLTLPIATGPALAAAAKLPKQHRRGGKAAARKAAATVTRKRADAAIAARKQNRTPNGSPASFTPLPEFDEAAAIKFRQQLSKDYQHPHAASAAVVKDESVAEKSIQPCHDDELVVSDVNAFRASLPSDYATPTKKSPE